MKHTLSFLVLLLSFLTNIPINSSLLASSPGYRQEEAAVWATYTTNAEEFSVLMPELPGVAQNIKCLDMRCRSKRVENTYASYSKGVVYLVISYQGPNLRQSFDEIISEKTNNDELNSSVTDKVDVNLGKYKGKKFIVVSKPYGYDAVLAFYLTDKHVYEVRAVGGSRNDPEIQEFFKSFTLGSKKGTEIGDGARLSAPSLAGPPTPKVDTKSTSDIPSGVGGAKLEKIFKGTEVTRKGIIVSKPSPEYTEDARRNQVTGTVTLQMVLASSGKVTNIRTISGLDFGLTEKAIAAARKIYFLPAIKDGKRVPQYIRVEYNFNIY